MRLIDPAIGDFERLRRDFRLRVPRRVNIADLCCDRHRHQPSRVAIHYENAAGDRQDLSFGELFAQANRCANLLTGLGVGRGDRVAIVLPQRPETALVHLACYKIGAIAVPLSILFGEDALAYRLGDSGARVVVTEASRYELLQAMRRDLPDLAEVIGCGCPGRDFHELMLRASDAFETASTAADDPALLIYTSGTTGPPKGALIAHRAIYGNLTGFEMSQDFFPQDGDLFWTPADWAWTGGLWDALLPTLYFGRPILAYEGGKFDPEQVARVLARHSVRNAFIPPTALKMLRQLPDLRSGYGVELRSVMSAGEAVGEELIHWGREALGLTINEMWGQTEFNYLVGNCAAIMAPKPGSMGKPYPGHRVEVIDAEGRILPMGETGELAAWAEDDPVVFLGYWNNDAATRGKFVDRWFLTGDVGYRDADGYIWYVGRRDDVISSAGYRIGPGEIEDCLIKHPAVLQAAAIGKPDPMRGSIVKAFVVLRPGHEASDELARSIQASVRDRLAAYEYPREVEFIDQLPMTTTGKVRRIELRQLEEQRLRRQNGDEHG